MLLISPDCMQPGWKEAGIMRASFFQANAPIGDMLRRLLLLAGKLDASALRDRLEFLSDW